MVKLELKDRAFYSKLLTIALPIALQNLISSSLNMVDTVMIGRLGEVEIAAVGLANQYFFLLVLLLFGINSGGAIFVSQFWGKRDLTNIKKVLGITMLFGGGISLVFAALAFFTPNVILRVFTDDQTVMNLGSQYLKIVSLSYLLTAISFAFSFALRSIGQAKLPMVISVISLITNTILNYVLIFGFLGFPEMGVRGAAMATLISRGVEITTLLLIIYGQKMEVAGKLSEMISIPKSLLKTYFNTGMPVILNEGLWSLGVTMYSISYARISTEAIASVQIANTVSSIFMVAAFGLGNACAVMIGNSIGANKEEEAIVYSKRFTVLSPIFGTILGIMLFISAPYILKLYNISDTVYYNAKNILMIMSFFLTFRIFNTILIIGILRGGGDTKYSLFLEMGCVWFFGVPMAFIGAHVLKLPVYWVVAIVSCEEVVKAIIGYPRVASRKWVKNIVESM